MNQYSEILSRLEDYTEVEAQKKFTEALEGSETVSDLQKFRWNTGTSIKEGPSIELEIENMIYLKFSKKIQELIDEISGAVIKNKQSSQVAVTTSEETVRNNSLKLQDGNHKLCDFCNKVILIADNYCEMCGKANPKVIS